MSFKLSLPSRRLPREVVGLDIEPGFVAAAEARVNGSVSVHRAAGAPLELDVVRDGEVLDADGLTAVLVRLFEESHLPRNVRLGVANQRTVLRTLELPPITDRKELAAAVRFQAQDEVPMPLHNAVLDFQPLGIVETPAGPRQRVVLVAAQRDMVERLLAAVRAAGLRPVGVDLAAFAMIRSLYHPGDEGRVVYLGVGGLTNMAVAEGSTCRFTRVLGGGMESMAADLAGRRQISLPEARELLVGVGMEGVDAPAVAVRTSEPVFDPALGFSRDDEDDLDVAIAPPPPAPAPAPAPAPDADVRRVLVSGVREIAGEVRNSLDFQQSHDGGDQVRSVILSGPGLDVPGLAAALERELGLPVEPRVVDGAIDAGPQAAQRLTVATGLAIEEPLS
jgi:type IV pilus assembly protein PilM